MSREATYRRSLALLISIACWLCALPGARATLLAPLLSQHALWASPNADAESVPQGTPSAPVGTLPGTFVVGDDGAAHYEIPLEVPAAARGLEPALALAYDSQAGDGPLGVGWSLSGQSAISRCPLELADDDRVAPVRMTSEDALCLDGARLRLISGNPLEPGAVYRAKRDNLARVRVVFSSNDDSSDACHGGFGFEVDRADGTIATYGCRRDATVTTHLGARTWALSRVRDRFGNFIEYRYQLETEPLLDSEQNWLGAADVEHVLASIEYGGHVDLHDATRRVVLEWEPRPDPWRGWFLGAPQRQSRRLAAISTFAEGAAVSRYVLAYDTPSVTGRSLLSAVRHCDAEGVCKPATTFTWEPGELGFAEVAPGQSFAGVQPYPSMDLFGDPNVPLPFVLDSVLLDANGDGRSDLLLAVGDDDNSLPAGRGWELWTSQPDAFSPNSLPCASSYPSFEACREQGEYLVFEAERSGPLPYSNFADLGQSEPPMFAADLDGDGRDDAISLGDAYILNGEVPPAGTSFYVVHALPDGNVTQSVFDPTNEIIWSFTATDRTGDGLGDLLYCAGPHQQPPGVGRWYFLANDPELGFAAQNVIDTGVACSAFDEFLQIDHDGDGVASLLVIPTWDPNLAQRIPSAQWSNYHALVFDAAWQGSLVDTGLRPDYAQRWRPSIVDNYNLAFLDDDFPQSRQGFGLDRVLDVNADGLPDILRFELVNGDALEQLHVIKSTLVTSDLPEWGGVRLWLNTGAGFQDGGLVLEADEPGDRFFRRYLASSLLDYDGDGRLDWLMPVADTQDGHWIWSVFLSRTDGFDRHDDVLDLPVVGGPLHVRTLSTVELDGDGLHDFALFYGGSWNLQEHVGSVPDKLVRIQNGLGAWVEVGYRSLADHEAATGFYANDLDACVYPQRCERHPRIVVEWHRVDDALAFDGRRFMHRYGSARSDRAARHGLGFEFHETIELDELSRPIYRRRVGYDHGHDAQRRAFPYVGMPATTLVDQRDPETGRHVVTHAWRSFDVLDTTPLTFFPYVSQAVTRSYELDGCAAMFCEVEDLDPDARTSDTVDTLHELDAFGHAKLRTTVIDTGSTLVTLRYEADYLNDDGNWLLGLPLHERSFYIELGQEPRERDVLRVFDPDTGAVQLQIREPTEPELFLHTSFAYDDHGNLVAYTSTDIGGEQRSSSVSFDAHGVFPKLGTNALGHDASMSWDAGLGVITEVTDPNGLRMVADYDGFGHLTGLRSFAGKVPRGDATEFSYAMLPENFSGAAFEVRSDTAGHGYQVTRHDRLGREVERRTPGLDGVRRDVITRYDRLGRVVRVSLPTPAGALPDFERFDYDFADRLVAHELADGTAQSWSHAGLVTTHVDFGGTSSVLTHDLAGRLIESARAVGTPDEERMCFDYGAFGLLERARPDCVERTPVMPDGEAPPTIKTYAHDDLGRVIFSDDPSEGPRELAYNGHGELDSYVDANGNLVEFTRDALGRVVLRSDTDGLTSWIWDLDFIGQPSLTTSPSGHIELFEHDAFGRLETLTKVIGGEPFELGFAYDAFGRLGELHYPQEPGLPEFWVRNVYAANGELLEVREGPSDTSVWRIDELDERGRITLERFGNDVTTARTHDPMRDLTRAIETTSHFGATLQSLHYQWNDDGTLAQREDLLHGQLESSTYDQLHRISSVTTTHGQQQQQRHFAYDSLGNLVFASERGEYEYDKRGRLRSVDGSIHSWDLNGNLLARMGTRPAELTYTAFDKPATIEDEAGLIELEYDASQQRVYRYSEADARETIYLGDIYERQHDAQTGVTEHHYRVAGSERIVAEVIDRVELIAAERSIAYLHTDHIGSIDVVSDAKGGVIQRMSFDLWGQRRDPEDWTLPDEFAELGTVNLGYTGHEAQLDAGLVNMNGRLYDPHVGRMASADPFVIDPIRTQGWNRYAYVLNQPLTLTDTSGFAPDEFIEFEDADVVVGDVVGIGGGGSSASGMLGQGQETNDSQLEMRPGGTTGPAANTAPGDAGPILDAGQAMAEYTLGGITSLGNNMFRVVSTPARTSHPLDAAAEAMVSMRPEGSYAEEQRMDTMDEHYGRFVHNMAEPPAYAMVPLYFVEVALGGELELGVVLAEAAGRRLAARRLGREVGEEALEGAARVAAKSATPSSRVLGKALEAAGHVRPQGAAAHHIVAGKASKAAPARRVLERFGIGINEASNGVFLPANMRSPNAAGAAVHSTLHTNSYYATVNEALAKASTREEALAALSNLRQQLLTGGL